MKKWQTIKEKVRTVGVVMKPHLEIQPYVYAELLAVNEAAKGEVSAFGRVRVNAIRRCVILEQIFVFPQEAGVAHAGAPAVDVADFFLGLHEGGVDINTVRLWYHSHGNGAPFHSTTDWGTIDTALSNAPWYVSLIGSKRGEWEAKLIILQPLRVVVDLDVTIHIPADVREWAEQMIQENVKVRPASSRAHPWRAEPTPWADEFYGGV